MTVTDIREQIALQTQQKIERMKHRNILLPARLIDRCALCDQLSQEIYDFAAAAVVKIVDRHHLRVNMDALLNALHEDFCKLSNGAIEVLIARQALQSQASDAGASSISANQHQLIGNEFERVGRMSPLLLLWNWIKLRWGARSAFQF